MKKRNSTIESRPILEELEARQLFSGGIEGLIDTSLVGVATSSHIEQSLEDETDEQQTSSTEAAEQQSHELVFVDSSVDDYQALINDLENQASETRNIEVVVLNNDRNGIEQISTVLEMYQDLDAVHIISHGADGSVQLGNTSLDAETLEQNRLGIALWANAFDESGDILFYGCNLAETEAGQSLITKISSLTLADVAASTDLSGHADFGGDWNLEFNVGSIEGENVVSSSVRENWNITLAAPVNTTPAPQTINEDSTLTFSAGNSNAISVSDGDADTGNLEVDLSVDQGTFSLSGVSGLTFTSGDGADDSSMVFEGSVTDINAALSGLAFTPAENWNGVATLTLTTTEQSGVDFDQDANITTKYTFDVDGTDAIGSNDATLVNSAAVIVDGERGNVLSLNGASQYASIPAATTQGLSEFTFSFWVKTTESGSSADPLQRPTLLGIDNGFSLNDLGITTDNGYIGMYTGLSGSSDDYLSTTTQINDNQWHQITVSNDGSNLTLYVDGTSEATLASGNALANLDFYLGAKNWTGAAPYDHHSGSYDDLRVFDRALTAQEVSDLHTGVTIASDTDQVTITVDPVNDAPVLDTAGNFTLTTITEDQIDNAGQTVASVIASAGGDRITDVDGDPEGMAIIYAGDTQGTWEYSVDSGTNWNAVGPVSASNALLLGDTDLLRFNPNGISGGIDVISFHAWDQSSGTAGDKVDASVNGGTTPSSADWDNAIITVTDVNDAPEFIENGVGYWQFEEGAGATTGDSAYGTSTGTLGSTAGADSNDPTWTTGQFGQALQFDGADDYVQIADAPELDISGPEFSASLWIKPDSGPNTEDMLFMKGDRQGNVNYYLSWKDNGNMTWAFKDGAGWHYLDMNVPLPTVGEWNHVAITFDRPTVTLYINGDQYTYNNVATGGSMDRDLTANDEVLMIGAGLSGGSLVAVNQFSGPFDGAIDELAIFDRALTAAEVEAIRTSQPAAATASNFTIDENSANSTVVGTVAVSDPDVGDTHTYAITAGNTNGAFAIDNNGVITVANIAALDFETTPTFNLTIQATDDGTGNLTDTTTVTINLNDVPQSISATGAATVTEGDTYTLDLSANDPVASWTINWGDGTVETIAGTETSATHVYGNGGFTNNISVAATDAAGTYYDSSLIVGNASSGTNGFALMYGFDPSTGTADIAGVQTLDTPTASDLDWAQDVVVGPNGNIFVSGYESQNIVEFDSDGNYIREIVTAPNGITTFDFGPDGNLYVGSDGDWIKKYDGTTGAFIEDVVAVTSFTPEELAFGPDGFLYVGDYESNSRIWRFDINGNNLDDGNPFIDPVNGSAADIQRTQQMTWGPDGNLYVASQLNGYIQRYDGTSGAYIDTFVDVGVNGGGWPRGPTGVAFGPDGNLYVLKVDTVMRYDGSTGAYIDDFVPAGGALDNPWFITFTPNQQVAVVSTNVDPVITSDGGAATAAIDVAENTTAVTTVTATDADGETPRFVISGGADQALFAIDFYTGALVFNVAPDFEGAGDNAYEVEVSAIDGLGGTDVQTINVTVTNVNEAPTQVNNTGDILAQGGTEAISNAELRYDDAEQAAANVTYNITTAPTNGQLELTTGPGVAINSFTQAQIDAGLVVYVHDGGASTTDSFNFNVSDGVGGALNAQTFSLSIVADSGQTLWITPEQDVAAPSGWNGISGEAVAASEILSLAGPNLALEPGTGTTDGDFTRMVDFAPMITSSPARVNALHVVGSNMTVGSNAISLQTGDVLFSLMETGTHSLQNSNLTTTDVQRNDIVIFRPDSPGDYSSGTYSILLDGADLGLNALGAFTLVEQATTVGEGGGATTLDAGDILFVDWNGTSADAHIQRLQPGTLGDTTTGTVTLLVDGNDLSADLSLGDIVGLDLVEQDTAIGGTLLQSGQILLTLYGGDDVGGTTVTGQDIAVLDVTTTGANSAGTAALLFDGSDVGLDAWQEDVRGLSLAPSINLAPEITSDGGAATATINVAENSTAVTTVTSTDVDGGTPTYSISGGDDQGLFSIDPGSGVLTFDSAPDYESAGDFSSDGIYVVEVTASDGNGGFDVQTISVQVTDVPEGIRVTPTSIVPLGSETLVNTETLNNQLINAGVAQGVATTSNGNYVVTWSSLDQDGDSWGVYAQLYNADGTPAGSEFRVTTETADAQLNAAVAMDDAGNFVITWQSNLQAPDGDGYGVFAQLFDASGTPQGGEILVNTTTSGFQGSAAVAMDADGDFAVTWVAYEGNSTLGIFAQAFDSAGTKKGGEFQVNTYTDFNQQITSIDMDDNGNFVITWASENVDGSNYGIAGQLFDASGNPVGDEFVVNTITSNSQLYHDVVMLGDGRFVVEYQSNNGDDTFEVYIQRFNADGSALGGPIQVNTAAVVDMQPIGSVTADDNGNITVAWNSQADGEGSSVVVRQLDWDGNPLTAEIIVNTTTWGNQNWPEVVAQPGGGFIVTWSGNGPGDDDGVFLQRYGLATTEQGSSMTFELVLESAPTADVVIPIGVSEGSEASLSTNSITFTSANWNVAQTVTVTGLQDSIADGDQAYSVNIGPATSTDPNFNGLNPANLSLTNLANTAPQMSEWFNSDWDSRKQLTISSAQVADDVSNFPVLITLNADAELAAQALANGDDIVFTAADGVTQLAHEIEFFDETTGEIRAWVKADLSGTVDTDIYLYFGNSASGPQENVAAVWDNYVGVYHLSESPDGTPGELIDSSGSNNHGVTEGSMDAADSVATAVGSGLAFDGIDDKIRIPNSAGLNTITDEATFSLWINYVDAADGQHQIVMTSEDRFSATDGYEWASNGSGEHFFYPDATTPDGNYNIGDNPFTNGTWHHLAATMDFNTKEVKIYVDGEPMTFTTEGVPTNWTETTTSTADLLWGGNPDRAERFFLGMMDEIRIADVARSQAWLKTEYNNQNAPGAFLSVGSSESREDQLTDINEDDFNSAGDTVSTIINSSGADRITDDDDGAVEGIAVVAVDDTNGQWQYDANADGSWQAFGTVSTSNAVLLDTGALVRFVPNADYNGTAGNITFHAWDQTMGSNGATAVDLTVTGGNTAYSNETFNASLNVLPVNDAPVNTVPGAQTVSEDTVLGITGISVNDVDGNLATTQLSVTNGNLNVSLAGGATISAGANGSSTLTLSGSQTQINAALATVSYQGNGNFNGSDTLTVLSTDSDGTPLSDSDTVAITVTQVDDAGTFGGNVSATTNEDTATAGTVTFADAVDGFTTPNFTLNTTASNGVATIDAAGNWTYAPTANFNGSDSFIVEVTDDDGNVETQTINITVNQVDDAGTFGGDLSATTNEDTATSGTVTFADTADGFTTPNFTLNTAASNGVATIDAAGNWSYAPTANFNGSDSFIVEVTDDDGNVETQTINITVAAINDAGAFGGDISATTNEDTATSGTVTFADTADGFTTPNFALNSAASNGVATIDAAGNWTYTPTANFNGSDSFIVEVTDDDGNVETQTININVSGVNNAGTFGGNISATTDEDTATAGTVTFVDTTDGFTTPNFTLNTAAADGVANIDAAGNWTYTPNANFNGSDSFIVEVTDDDGNVETQTINITVTQVDDAGTFGGDVSATTNEDTATAGTVTFADTADGFTTPNFTLNTAAANGVANIDAAGNWTYTPNANFNGSDSFIVEVTDDDGNVETQTINITVTQVDDAGTFGGDVSATTNEDTSTSGTVTFADAADGFTAPNFTLNTAASNGVATIDTAGNWTYSPTANYSGADSFIVEVTDDDGNVETQTISLTVNPVDDAGTFGGDISATTNEDTATAGTVTFTDTADGFTAPNFTLNTNASNGVATIDAAGNWTYTPNANYNGADSFVVEVTDDDGNVETQTINITVTDVNDAPTGTTLVVAALEETATLIDISGNVSDADGTVDLTTTTVTSGPGNGVLTNNGDGTFSYTGNTNFVGTDSFTYTVQDNDGQLSSDITVTINVSNVNDVAVIAGDDAGLLQEDVAVVANQIRASGTLTVSDPDAGESMFQAATVNGAYGDLTIDTAGNWSYAANNNQLLIQQLDAGQSVSETLTVRSLDGTSQDVLITIQGSEDSATISGDTRGSVVESSELTTSGALSISDADATDSPVFTNVASTSSDSGFGSFAMVSGTWTYTLDDSNETVQALNTGEVLTDSFTFTASDGSAQRVTVTINGITNLQAITVIEIPEVIEEEPVEETDNTVTEQTEQTAASGDAVEEAEPAEVSAETDSSASITEPPSNIRQAIDQPVEAETTERIVDIPVAEVRQVEIKPAEVSKPKLAELLQRQVAEDQVANDVRLGLSDSSADSFDTELEERVFSRLDELQQDIQQDSSAQQQEEVEVQIALGSTAGLTAGFVGWILRGGALFASMLSSVPLLNRFDPLPILKTRNDRKVKADDDNPEGQSERKVEALFEQQDSERRD